MPGDNGPIYLGPFRRVDHVSGSLDVNPLIRLAPDLTADSGAVGDRVAFRKGFHKPCFLADTDGAKPGTGKLGDALVAVSRAAGDQDHLMAIVEQGPREVTSDEPRRARNRNSHETIMGEPP
jgi:hypothetical protein